jgi:hypothetical protein
MMHHFMGDETNQYSNESIQAAMPFVDKYVEHIHEAHLKLVNKYISQPLTDQESYQKFDQGSVECRFSECMFRFAQILQEDLQMDLNGE